ncbi:MAG: HPr family phosphocarrier protein [Zhaonellaceae bacterium]|jgi:phosphotransferase system HPr (HPr) family protein|nr:HPr family phosphocarrier protein [Clostridia bacterium]
MQQKTLLIENSVGLHARPAALMVQAAKKFNSTIELRKGAKRANAKSITSIMQLAVKCGEEVDIIIEGSDEKEALAYIEQLVKNKFGEV